MQQVLVASRALVHHSYTPKTTSSWQLHSDLGKLVGRRWIRTNALHRYQFLGQLRNASYSQLLSCQVKRGYCSLNFTTHGYVTLFHCHSFMEPLMEVENPFSAWHLLSYYMVLVVGQNENAPCTCCRWKVHALTDRIDLLFGLFHQDPLFSYVNQIRYPSQRGND